MSTSRQGMVPIFGGTCVFQSDRYCWMVPVGWPTFLQCFTAARIRSSRVAFAFGAGRWRSSCLHSSVAQLGRFPAAAPLDLAVARTRRAAGPVGDAAVVVDAHRVVVAAAR